MEYGPIFRIPSDSDIRFPDIEDWANIVYDSGVT